MKTMKHSRAEVVKSTVCSYLKRRQYTDSEVFLKSDLQLCQTKQQLAVLSAVNKEAANKNSITFGSFVFDLNVVDQHFSRLKSWIFQLSGSVQKELWAFLPPLLCHLTIDLLRWNVVLESNPLSVTSAINFLKKHASSLVIQDTREGNSAFGFCHIEERNHETDQDLRKGEWRLLEELNNIENCWDICKSKSLLLFRSCKYRLNLTSEALVLLQRYLADHAHICLIQAIGTWFDVVEISGSGLVNEEEAEDEEDEIVVQMWEEGREDNSDPEKTSCIKDLSVAVNGCKEDGAPSLASEVGASLNENSEPAGSAKEECGKRTEEGEEEEKQLRLLEGAIRGMRGSPSALGPLLLYSLENGDNNIICTNISHGGEILAAGFGTSDIKVWGLTEGGMPAEVREVVGSNVFHNSKDKKQTARLACDIDAFDGEAYGSMVEEEEEEWMDSAMVLRGHCNAVQGVTISGQLLFSCSSDTTLRAWNLNEQTCAAIYRGHGHPIWCLDVCAWGLYMATGSQDRTARLWSPERAFPLRTYAGHGLDVDCIQFHPNGLYLATGSCDHSVRLWSVSEGKLVRVFPHPSRGRTNPNAERSVSARSPASFSPSVTALAFSPDGKYLASGAEDQRVRIWDLAAGSVVNELSTYSTLWPSESQHAADEASHTDGGGSLGIHGSVSGLCWSSGGERLACSFHDGTVAVWDVKGGAHCGEHSQTSSIVSQASINPSFEDGQKTNSDGSECHSLALSTYSTGMRPLSSLRYIEREVLVGVGSTPARYVI